MILPPVEGDRAGQRRAQIMDAALKRFGQDGFHGASMADIAAEAGMSVGHIYRYFENKEAIIAAIVARDMAQSAQQAEQAFAETGDVVEELISIVKARLARKSDPACAALALEILAEAARNPRIAEIVRLADEAVRARLRQALTRGCAPVDEETLHKRLDMMAMLIDGWVIRVVKNPGIDAAAYVEGLRAVLRVLMAEPPLETS